MESRAIAAPLLDCKISSKEISTHQKLGWPRDPDSLTSIGSPRILILALDFSDAPAEGSAESYINSSVDLTKTKEFFQHISQNRFQPAFTVYKEYVRMPKPSAQYGTSTTKNSLMNNEYQDLILTKAALNQVSNVINISDFQAVVVIVTGGFALSGYVGFSTSQDQNQIKTKSGSIKNSILLGNEAVTSKATPGWRILVHEMSHLLGIPDLYLYQVDGAYQGKSTGLFGQMSYFQESRTEAINWNLWNLGWIPDSQVKCYKGILSLRNLKLATDTDLNSGIRLVLFKISQTMVIAVEPVGPNLIDTTYPEGLLIYSVDSTVATGYGPIKIITKKNSLSSAPLSPLIPDWLRFEDAPLHMREYVFIGDNLFVNSSTKPGIFLLSIYRGSAIQSALKALDVSKK